jgi:integrase
VTSRETRFGKTRIVALHLRTTLALRRYASIRDDHPVRWLKQYVFTGDPGRPLIHANPHFSLILWTRQAGLREPDVAAEIPYRPFIAH